MFMTGSATEQLQRKTRYLMHGIACHKTALAKHFARAAVYGALWRGVSLRSCNSHSAP